MALQGTLDTFALADLVQLLASTGKTGELAIDGDRGHGSLWFSDGALVGGEPGEGSVDALFELLRFGDGSFRFDADVAPAAGHEPADAMEALGAAQERMAVWAPVEALVPSPRVTLDLSAELRDDAVTIDRERWGLLVAVAGGTTAGAFAERSGLSEFDAGLTIKALVDDGLVTVGPEAEVEPDVEVDAEVDAAPEAVAEVVDAAETPEATADDVAAVEERFVPVEVEDVDVAEPVVDDVVADEPVADVVEIEDGPADEVADVVGEQEPQPAPAEDDGSLLVDLDTHLGGGVEGHSYLATAAEVDVLPEPLPGDGPGDDAWVDPASESDPAAADAASWADGDEDLAVQLEALSPAAAAAVAAAAADAGAEEGTEEGRRVLRRIISKG